MPDQDAKTVAKQDQKREPEKEEPPELFPGIYNLNSLREDKTLPIIKFVNFADAVTTSEDHINLTVEMPERINSADLFLFVNDEKRDLFYHASGGKYTFKNILLENKINQCRFFYRIGNRKSSSVYTIVSKQSFED